MKKLFFFLVALLTSVGAWAFEVDGITYNVVSAQDLTVEVTGYNSSYVGDLEINGTVTYEETEYKVVSIGSYAFQYCSKKISVGNLPYCTTIGNDAFKNCYGLKNIGELMVCTNIRNGAFENCQQLESITLTCSEPPTIYSSYSGGDRPQTTIFVPAELIEQYQSAWRNFSSATQYVPIGKQTVYDINVTAQDDRSGIHSVIGEENLANVTQLKLSGTINGYDIMVIRDKMPNLHRLDMTNVDIVANAYVYYSLNGSYRTSNNVIGDYFFYNLRKLTEVKLPTSITTISRGSFKGDNGSYNYPHLSSIIIPEGVKTIGGEAFQSIQTLKNITLPSSLLSIPEYAFANCTKLSRINLTVCPDLSSIGNNAFNGCYSLTEVRLSQSIKSIGGGAFSDCSYLVDVYVQPILPRTITSGTFSNAANATLHTPKMTYEKYYWATGWSSFKSVVEDVDPNLFYVDADLEIAEGKSTSGKVDATVENYGGIINDDTNTQAFDELNVNSDGTNTGSLIVNDNMTADNLFFNINVIGNRWHFFSFPFRVSLSDVEAPGSFVFRRYDGAKRALDGSSGWSALADNTEYLEPGVGYIFQCNKSGTLKIQVASPNFNWGSGKQNELTEHVSGISDQHASWNFVGNPLTCYYDIDEMHYNSPLTIWDGSKYVAYRPGDDNYQLHPFEAFFLQKPNDNDGPQYDKSGRMTYTQATTHHSNKAAVRRMEQGPRDRFLLNLVLSNGTDEDQTRVVFNEKTKKDYEMECDAAKFMSSEQVPQLFSVYANTRYAINERPQGEVMLGFTAPTAGSYTLRAERMDMPVVVKDLVMGTTHELKNGEYTFETEAGTFESRFVLMPAGDVTAISNTKIEGAETESVYTLDGKQLPNATKGVNIVRKGNEVQKVVTK